MLDGRSLYQDFFGFVMWDFLPVNFNEVKQVEVIRGPASAVWGANALYGVVNVIGKSPRELKGMSSSFGFGGFDRPDADAGSLWSLSATWADAPNDRWSRSCRAGCSRRMPSRGRRATLRPRRRLHGHDEQLSAVLESGNDAAEVRCARRLRLRGRTAAVVLGGVAGTDVAMHSGIGPFDIGSGSVMGYGKATFSKGGFRAGFFTNILKGEADQLLTVGLNGRRSRSTSTRTRSTSTSRTSSYGKRHVFSYGGNLRFNNLTLSIALDADNRTEFGGYGQDEIFLSEQFRWVVGVRADRFDYIDDFVFSPRTTFMVAGVNHTVRVSATAPTARLRHQQPHQPDHPEPLDLRALGVPFLYLLPVSVVGNQDLQEQSLDAFEVGYREPSSTAA